MKYGQKKLERHFKICTTGLIERNKELEKNLQKIRKSNELIRAENRHLKEKLEKLKELDNAKLRFFTYISHEFRTLLTLTKAPIEQILSENPDKMLEIKLKPVLCCTNSLFSMVDQLLELEKLENSKMKLKAALQDIVPFVKKILMYFEPLASKSKVILNFQAETQEIMLYFDPEKLERIITNILSNAFNFTPSGGKIDVSIRNTETKNDHQSDHVEIVVRDTGKGIPEEQLPNIFDRFYQGDNFQKYNESRRKGTGIGLSLAKELMELHHGQILVHSCCPPDPTTGTEFILRLPTGKTHLKTDEIVEMTEHHINLENIDVLMTSHNCTFYPEEDENEKNKTKLLPEYPEAKEPRKFDKPLLLLVDDNLALISFIKRTLQTQFNIEVAVNGKEAFEKARNLLPDLVISDIMMPELDGYELCLRLKQNNKTNHIPIVFLTAKASQESMAGGFRSGADDYIVKPFNTEILKIRVSNLILSRRQLIQKMQRNILHPEDISVLSEEKKFLIELKTILEKHIFDTEFNVEQLARKLSIGSTSLRRKVFNLTGETPNSLIRSCRLTRGAQLLKANYGNVTQVAFAVGFSDAAYFAKCFKEKFKTSPHQFKG